MAIWLRDRDGNYHVESEEEWLELAHNESANWLLEIYHMDNLDIMQGIEEYRHLLRK